MRVALVGAELEENLALRYIDAALRAAGHQPAIFDFHASAQIPALVEQLTRYRPEVVGLSMVFTARAREFLQLAAALREAGSTAHLTAGGFFASLHAEQLLRDEPALDSVLHGEGEEGLVELLANLPRLPEVRGLSRRLDDGHVVTRERRALEKDLDTRPWPTRPARFHAYQGLPIANLLSGRGCYAHCHFCSIDAWTRFSGGPRFRQRAVEPLADEMAALYRDRGVRIFNFHDDNFFLPKEDANLERFSALFRLLGERGVGRIGLQVKARPDSITPKVVEAMVRLGIFRVFLGIESNSVNGLKALGRGVTREQNHRALSLLREAGLHVAFNLLMFEPHCTLQDLRENVDFIRGHTDVPLNFCRTEVYGGTPLERELKAAGRLVGNYLGYEYRIIDPDAQRAWEITEAVFTPRNFTLEGSNHRAMAVEYEWKILQHFRPRQAGARLTKRVHDYVRAVNGSNVELLDAVIALAAKGPAHQAAGTEALVARLTAAEASLARRSSSLLAAIHRAAEEAPLSQRVARVAAGAAAAAALLVGPGCDELHPTHATEMVAAPLRPRTCTPAELAKVQGIVAPASGGPLARALQRHEGIGRFQVRLRTDERGVVTTVEPLLAPGHGGLENEVVSALTNVNVGVPSAECVVALSGPPETAPEPGTTAGADAAVPDAGPPPPPPPTHFAEMVAPPTHMSEMAPRPLKGLDDEEAPPKRPGGKKKAHQK